MLHDDPDFERLAPLQKAEQELKRIDHLIYVSLKYTRTVDVFKSIITRLMSTGGYLGEALLEHAKEKGVLKEFPENSAVRCELVKTHYAGSELILQMIDDYKYYRRLNKAEYTKKNEFRRHVTMTVEDGDQVFEIKMETLTEYYKKLKGHYQFIKEVLSQ
jgi:hypothetical protein